jgi:hypothetical protein
MIGQEPGIVAVVRCKAVHQRRDPVLLPDAAGGANQAVRVRGTREHQGVPRPRDQMFMQPGDRANHSTRERKIEERDVAGLTRRQIGGLILGRRQRARAAATLPSRINTWAFLAWARAKPGAVAMARSNASIAPG